MKLGQIFISTLVEGDVVFRKFGRDGLEIFKCTKIRPIEKTITATLCCSTWKQSQITAYKNPLYFGPDTFTLFTLGYLDNASLFDSKDLILYSYLPRKTPLFFKLIEDNDA
jgi:hypothetical protein